MNPYDELEQPLQHEGFKACEHAVRRAIGLPDDASLWGAYGELDRLYNIEEQCSLESDDRKILDDVFVKAHFMAEQLIKVLKKNG